MHFYELETRCVRLFNSYPLHTSCPTNCTVRKSVHQRSLHPAKWLYSPNNFEGTNFWERSLVINPKNALPSK